MAQAAGGARSGTRWFVLFLISLMYLITYMDRANISVTAPAMAREFGLSKVDMGLVFSAFAWAYAAGQIPGGWLGDRFGPKRVLLAIVSFWSLMTAMTAWASSLVTLFGVRFVFGLGEAGAFPTASRAMQLWFPKGERGIIQGVTHCFSRLAVAVTPFVAIEVMSAFGWRAVFYSFATLGAVWAAAFAVLYRNRPQEHPRVNQAELDYIRGGSADAAIHSTQRQSVPWKRIFGSANMWYIAAAYFCFFYGSYFYLTWFPTYLLEYRHLAAGGGSLCQRAADHGDDRRYHRRSADRFVVSLDQASDIIAADRSGAGVARCGRFFGAGGADRRRDDGRHLSRRIEFLP